MLAAADGQPHVCTMLCITGVRRILANGDSSAKGTGVGGDCHCGVHSHGKKLLSIFGENNIPGATEGG